MNCFIYARKSSESEEKQILSIDAQIKELKAVALKQGLKIVEVFSEAKSAKAPGRPIFNKMMQSVFDSDGVNVLCWKLDRLARNPVDGGSIIWAVEQNKLAGVFTPSNDFKNSGDDKFFMQLEFGIAKKFVDDLSDNVKRGLRAKLEKGIFPGRAPIGYLNDKVNKTVVKDPDRFHLVRRLWDTILSEEYNIKTLLETADKSWGLTTTQFKRMGGNPLTLSALYKIFSNPFYYGVIKRRDGIYSGSHEPMISKEEFEKVQTILGRPSSKPKFKSFAFTGMIMCSECGGMITAEEQINRYGYRYIYYRCTKKKGGRNNNCRQKYIRAENLEAQTLSFLEKIQLPEKMIEWYFNRLEDAKNHDEKFQKDIGKSLSRSLINCDRKLDSLLDLKLKDLLTDEEYVSQKARLFDKKLGIEREITSRERNPQIWLEPSKSFFSFVSLAKINFENGDDALKGKILKTIGSNLLLKDKILLIEAKEPFRLIAENEASLLGHRLVDDVRTFFADPSRHFHIPQLKR